MLAFLRSALLEYISSGDCFQSSSRCDTLSTPWARLQCVPASNPIVVLYTTFLVNLTSNQVGLPAELKHINKRRKRN